MVRPNKPEPRLRGLRGNFAESLDNQVAPLVPIKPADEEHQVGVGALQPPSSRGHNRRTRGREDQGVLQIESVVGAGSVEDIGEGAVTTSASAIARPSSAIRSRNVSSSGTPNARA